MTSMVGLDNVGVTNTNPPKITLIALGVFQFGVALALAPRLSRWLANIGPWTAVVAVNASTMTLAPDRPWSQSSAFRAPSVALVLASR